ncbi:MULTISPECIES: alpha/beta fold hydrolase [unclassified Rhizobium]|uniref:alpha/beta fold hydrolase n=1 Tax=unclassified Rhizobium TaxID=2613769 RepID=UPI001ADC34D3|nr:MULTISPECIES: alpha/beta hydrolase [unclassified Rhizobium]MBO9127773.1 alpha/beta hydrolase [Rhizobium sp. 16-488-2b]MBO9178235.1 alpha/beta hydrolase [Rhizobium sp. 16-488-2a]
MPSALPDIGEISNIEIDGVNVRIASGGRTDGIPVVLSSPWPESIYAFRNVLSVIGAVAPYVAIDLPGFGMSQGRSDLMSPMAMARFIERAAWKLGIKKMHGVGPDVGALAMLFAAADRPDLFEALVVGGGATSVELAAGYLVDLIASPPGQFASMEGGDLAVDFVSQSATVSVPPSVMEDYWHSSAAGRFDRATNFVRAYSDELPLLKRLLPKIEPPVLVLAGRHDALVPPANGQLLEEHVPRCRQVLLEGGHLIWEDAAAEYAMEIRKWIEGGYISLPTLPSDR